MTRTSLLFQVDADALLVAVDGQEVTALAGLPAAQEGWPPFPGVIPSNGVLDLDDLGSEVTQDHGAVGPGKNTAQIQDADAVKRPASLLDFVEKNNF